MINETAKNTDNFIKSEVRYLNGSKITYSLTRNFESGQFSVSLSRGDTLLVAPCITSDPNKAFDFFEKIADGYVTEDSFFEIVDDFLCSP